MYLRFYIDPETDLPHIFNHGVDEDEVEEILATYLDGWAGRGNSRIAVGRTFGGRYLKVIYTRDPEPGRYFVITAYELSGRQLRAHRRRMRRKGL